MLQLTFNKLAPETKASILLVHATTGPEADADARLLVLFYLPSRVLCG